MRVTTRFKLDRRRSSLTWILASYWLRVHLTLASYWLVSSRALTWGNERKNLSPLDFDAINLKYPKRWTFEWNDKKWLSLIQSFSFSCLLDPEPIDSKLFSVENYIKNVKKNVKIVSPDCNRAGQLNPDYNGWLGVPGPLSCSLSIHCGYHQTSIFELTPTSDSRHNRVFKYDNSIVNCTLCRPNTAPLISPSQDGEMFSQMLSFH